MGRKYSSPRRNAVSKPVDVVSSSYSDDNYSWTLASDDDDDDKNQEDDKDDDSLFEALSDGFLQFMDDDNEYENRLFYSAEEQDSHDDDEEEEGDNQQEGRSYKKKERKYPRGRRVAKQQEGRRMRFENDAPRKLQEAAMQVPTLTSPTAAAATTTSSSRTAPKQFTTGQATGYKQTPTEPDEKSTLSATTNPSEASKQEQSSQKAANDPTLSISGMTPWVHRYLASRPCLLVIPRDFWLDNFNLVQLPAVLEFWIKQSPTARGIQFPTGWLYKQALQRILAQDSHATAESAASAGVVDDIVEWAASLLYQLVHQRYVVSPRGLEAVRRRFIVWQYQSVKKNPLQPPPFGRCPRASCGGFALVPSGPDHPPVQGDADSRHWRYCGACRETWQSSSNVAEAPEGCAWGSTIGPLFHLTFPGFLQGTQQSRPTVAAAGEPRVFGFRLHPGAVGRIASTNGD